MDGELKRSRVRGLATAGVAGGFALGLALVGWQAWVVVASGPRPPRGAGAQAGSTGLPSMYAGDLAELLGRGLQFPIDGLSRAKLTDSFQDPRRAHVHHALDILAPRFSPVRAVDDGLVSRLISNATGGITVYQLDASERYCYYYAHLASYASGLREGQAVARGQVLGYVGTTGNAPRSTPHLHFAIFRIQDPKRAWSGVPINPYPLLKSAD